MINTFKNIFLCLLIILSLFMLNVLVFDNDTMVPHIFISSIGYILFKIIEEHK